MCCCRLDGWTCRGPCCLLAPPSVLLEVAVVAVVEDNPLEAGTPGTEAAGCPAVVVASASVTLVGEVVVVCL